MTARAAVDDDKIDPPKEPAAAAAITQIITRQRRVSTRSSRATVAKCSGQI